MSADEVSITPRIEGDPVEIEAMWRGQCVGRILSTLEGRRLCINDIRVEDKHPVPYCCLHGFLIRLGFSCRTVSFRKQGIGSRMLTELLSIAELKGVEEVWGSVVQEDIDQTLELLEWYERFGFTVSEPDGECMTNERVKVSKKMSTAGGPR